MSVPATLRDAVPEDAATILRFVRALAEYEKLAHEAQGSEADFRAALSGPAPHAHAIIAELGGAPVGFCLWFRTFSTFAARHGIWVEDVFVEPAHRGRGIGRAMFRTLAHRVIAEGGARLEWNVLDWNAPAIGAYRAMGAEPVEGWTRQRMSGAALETLAGG